MPIDEFAILKLTEHYESTGFISDALIPFFQQDGRWLGDRRGWRRSTYVATRNRMRSAILPASRRVARGKSGGRLLTSFESSTRKVVNVPYSKIHGSIKLSPGAGISAPNLVAVGNHIETRSECSLYLPYLRHVGGDFDCRNTWCFRARRLIRVGGDMQVHHFDFPMLSEVGGRLWIGWTDAVRASRLVSVGGTLELHASKSFRAPRLLTVVGDLVMRVAKQVHVPKLESAGRNFVAARADTIDARRLRRVGRDLITTTAKEFFRPGLVCGNEWRAHPEAIKRSLIHQIANDLLQEQTLEL